MNDKFLIPVSFLFAIICFWFLFYPEHFVPQRGHDQRGRFTFANNGIITASLTNDGTINRAVDTDEVTAYFSGVDTVYLRLENDGLLFVPDMAADGTKEYKVYSRESRTYAIAVMNVSEAQTFAYWVLTYPPDKEDEEYINGFYFDVITEKIIE